MKVLKNDKLADEGLFSFFFNNTINIQNTINQYEIMCRNEMPFCLLYLYFFLFNYKTHALNCC